MHQRLPTKGKSENPAVAQSMELAVSAGLPIDQNPKEVGPDAREGMDSPARLRASRQREQASFLHVIYISCQQRVGPD